MSLIEILLIVALVFLLALLVLQIVLVVRNRRDDFADLRNLLTAARDDGERLERGLRDDARAARGEQAGSMEQLRDSVQGQFAQLAQAQHVRIEGFGQRLDQLTQRTDLRLETLRQALLDDARKARDEGTQSQLAFRTLLESRLAQLGENSQQRLAEVRATLEAKLKELQLDNAKQLEAMRVTVDEKLHATLE
ncbi:MAG TPA: DNA recombination protein RmuC, partial [Tahibacter sp.]|nr:DNA recombination protein RmuC [Tahibacter sp.]